MAPRLLSSRCVGIAVFTVYFVALSVLLWANVIHTLGGFLVMAIVGLVGFAVIRAAGHIADE